MAAPATAAAIRDVNTRYHDAAAEHYDTKWGVDYGPVGRGQVRGKLHKLLGSPLPTFERSLEIGAGTGYFTLNMLQDGVVRAATATDISPGMLDALQGNAARIGVEVETVACDAEALPFADESFDLVLGHAVLHHLPHLDDAFAEFLRVLRPGGRILFAGEPSRTGDRIAQVPKRLALRTAPLWRTATSTPTTTMSGPRSRATSTASRSSRSSTSTRSRPTSSACGRAAPAFTPSRSVARSFLRTGSAG
jgi:SAM-dependent methyltransferase